MYIRIEDSSSEIALLIPVLRDWQKIDVDVSLRVQLNMDSNELLPDQEDSQLYLRKEV